MVLFLILTVFSINNLIVTRLRGDIDNNASLSSLNEVKSTKLERTQAYDEFNIPDNAKFYKLYYGIIGVGEKIEFEVDVDQKPVNIEIYFVNYASFYYSKDNPEPIIIDGTQGMYNYYKLYGDVSVYNCNSQITLLEEIFIIAHTPDYAKVYDVLVKNSISDNYQ